MSGCALPWGLRRQAAVPLGLGAEGREQPALSGDGRLLASLVERGGRTTVLLQERRSGKVLPLRHLRKHQPHASPSLSWNGRYLALLIQRGQRRDAVIEDRLRGSLLPLRLGGDREPQRLSLAPDGQRIAIEVVVAGRRQVEVYDLGGWLEPDLPGAQALQGGGPGPQP
ncbi:Tol biopolymer transporter periplasmic protein [Synechococcus sp. CCY9202]|uniref:Tol biopolymer transporter periplasmic protein n=1 Tax=Synechococcus sp. CCY9202 TaxID=174698 RepID=UPI002B1F84E8|nr:Tol biopolymer transporter periplasmic protein [Synechococcus sp. CCY9202]MEA5422799.1 Tol biopolymer transporter periplasmic protein [Synechococcus sp. CCY9202]